MERPSELWLGRAHMQVHAFTERLFPVAIRTSMFDGHAGGAPSGAVPAQRVNIQVPIVIQTAALATIRALMFIGAATEE